MTEASLTACRAGQREAIERLFRTHAPMVNRLIGRLVGPTPDLEDLVQTTFLTAMGSLGRFRGEASLKTWAFSIATRVASDRFRKPENRRRIVGVDEAADLPDPGAAAEDVVIRKEMNACMWQVVDSLPESYRAPLILHDLEGLSITETASICESPVPATKIRIRRARLRLAEALRARCNLYHDSRDVLRCDRVP